MICLLLLKRTPWTNCVCVCLFFFFNKFFVFHFFGRLGFCFEDLGRWQILCGACGLQRWIRKQEAIL